MTNPELLTNEEWREFQNIPDQGYSHRGWVDNKITGRVINERERITAAVREVLHRYDEEGYLSSQLAKDIREALGEKTETKTEDEDRYVMNVNDFEWLLLKNGKIIDRAPLTREGHDDLIIRNGLGDDPGAMLFKDEK